MIKVYLDRAARSDAHGVIAIAGAMFWPFFYDQFLHLWEPFLRDWNAKAFHATDFYPGAGEFWRKHPDGNADRERTALFERDSRRLPELINPYVRKLFVVAFRKEEYESVAPLAWRQQFGPVNFVAAQMMAQSIGHWASREKHEGEISYFYETGEGPEEAEMHKGLLRVYDEPRLRRHSRMASTPVGVGKGNARGLEVADFLAWHWNKYAAETRGADKPRPLRADIKALMEMLGMRGEKIDVRLFTGARLRSFLLANGCTTYETAGVTG